MLEHTVFAFYEIGKAVLPWMALFVVFVLALGVIEKWFELD